MWSFSYASIKDKSKHLCDTEVGNFGFIAFIVHSNFHSLIQTFKAISCICILALHTTFILRTELMDNFTLEMKT